MSAAHPKYRLFESTGFLFPDLPALADSDDFDALSKWARDRNVWQGKSARALIVSDEGRFWKVPRKGEIVEISNARQRSGGSQVKRYKARLDHGPSPGDQRYELPPAERWQHKTIRVPGHDEPEVEDTLDAIDEINRPRVMRPPKRLTAAENKAIEQHAVDLVRRYFEDRHYTTIDVGASESYDVHAARAGHVVKIEVKGTTSDGSEIILTYNEVELHKAEHPSNALAVVKHIVLDRDGPAARGGELFLQMPWDIEPERLRPIAYRYRIGD